MPPPRRHRNTCFSISGLLISQPPPVPDRNGRRFAQPWGGVGYVDVNELFESEVGQKAIRDLEKITKRLGLDRSPARSASPDRTPTKE